MEPGSTLNKGDAIRENRSGAAVETVLRQTGNIVETYQGNTYHITKIVRAVAQGAPDLPPLPDLSKKGLTSG
jgi:hypothetical protein